MEVVTVSEARERLYRLVGDVSAAGEPVLITGKRGNAILLSEDDWRAIQETLYLLSVPGMRESIRQGMTTRVADCAPEPGYNFNPAIEAAAAVSGARSPLTPGSAVGTEAG